MLNSDHLQLASANTNFNNHQRARCYEK